MEFFKTSCKMSKWCSLGEHKGSPSGYPGGLFFAYLLQICGFSGRNYKKTVRNRSSLQKTRDLFCFCAFTGLRYSDMAALKRTDITSDLINVITEKTDCTLKVPLNAYSRAILQKYEDERYPGNLALPVITNQKMNEYLKDLCEICGFNTPIKYSYYRCKQ